MPTIILLLEKKTNYKLNFFFLESLLDLSPKNMIYAVESGKYAPQGLS